MTLNLATKQLFHQIEFDQVCSYGFFKFTCVTLEGWFARGWGFCHHLLTLVGDRAVRGPH